MKKKRSRKNEIETRIPNSFFFYFGILWFTLSSRVSLFLYICDDDQTYCNMRSPSIPLLFSFFVFLLLEWLGTRLRCSSILFARALSSGWSLLVPLFSIVSRHFVRPNLPKLRLFFTGCRCLLAKLLLLLCFCSLWWNLITYLDLIRIH